MEVYAGFLEHTDHHVGRLIDTLEELEVLDNTLIYYIIGDNGASAEGTPQRLLQRAGRPQRRRRLETAEFMTSKSTSSARPTRTTTMRSAGRTPWTRRTSGRSRSHRTGVAHATARSSTGQRHQGKGEVRSQFHHVIDMAPTVLEAAGLPEPTSSTASSRCRCRAQHGPYPSTMPAAPERRETQYFEMFVQPRHLPQGLDSGDPPQHAVGDGPKPALDDDVWELYAPDDWTQAHDLAKENPREAGELQRLFLIEAAKYNVLPLDDRRLNASTRISPGGRSSSTATPDAVRRHGAAERKLDRRDEEQVALRDGGDRWSGSRGQRRHRRAGRRLRRLEPLCPGRQAGVLLQPLRAAAIQGLRRATLPRASTRCAWSSPTMAAASARGAP